MAARRKTSTTMKSKACKILSRKAPNITEYMVAILPPADLPRVPRAPNGMAASSDPIPDPHEWPAYGGTCWRQAYDEARAWNALVLAAQLWVYAQGAGYMPQSQREAFYVAYVQSKMNYQLCWQVMEDCLQGMVA